MFCENCGFKLRENAAFCPKCGTAVKPEEAEKTKEKEQYTSLVPDFKDIDESKSVSERVSDIEKPLFKDKGDTYIKPKKNKKKLIVILSSVIVGLIVAAVVILIIVSQKSGMTNQKIYNEKFCQALEKKRDSIVEFENDCGANGVAFYDVNHSGVTDVIYITKNDTSESDADRWYLHCLTDGEEDVEIDIEDDMSGTVQSYEAIFLTDTEDCIYVLNKNRMYKLIFEKDETGKGTYRVEITAQRVYDDEEKDYSCVLLSDSGELESVSKDEYDKYTSDICNRNVTILISALSEEELEDVFTTIDDNISENFDQAIEKLKNNDVVPVSNNDKNVSETGMIEEETIITEQEKKNRNFVNDYQLVEYDDVVYYVDNKGLWKKELGYDSKLLSEGSATNLATDGRVIYYGVFNEKVPYWYGKQKIDINQYDMYRYDLKTETNEKLTSFIEAGRPICAIGDIIYYTDYSDDFDGNMAGLAQGLRSYNMSTGEKEYICGGAHIVDSWNNKIFYREIMTAGGGYGVHQIHCYDTNTGKSEIISDDNVISFKVISDKLYYEITSFSDFSGNAASNQIWIYSYDVSSGETKQLFEKTAQINDIKFYDDKYIYYISEDSLIRFDLNNETEEKIPSYILDGSNPQAVWRFGDNTLFAANYDSGCLYLMDDDSLDIIARSENFTWRTVLEIKDKIAFTVDKDSNNYYFYTISIHELE